MFEVVRLAFVVCCLRFGCCRWLSCVVCCCCVLVVDCWSLFVGCCVMSSVSCYGLFAVFCVLDYVHCLCVVCELWFVVCRLVYVDRCCFVFLTCSLLF